MDVSLETMKAGQEDMEATANVYKGRMNKDTKEMEADQEKHSDRKTLGIWEGRFGNQ